MQEGLPPACPRGRSTQNVHEGAGPGTLPGVTTIPALEHVRRTIAARAGTAVRTVAAVGNAPLDPDPARASALDAADVVFRVNGFRLDRPGSVPAVGTRTDVVVFNRATRATPWVFDRYRQRTYLLVEPGRMTWEPETIPAWWPRDLGWTAVPNREVTLPLAEALGVDARRDGQWATTGTYAAWLARTLFPDARLLLAGYSFIALRDQTSWEHAYGDPCPVGPEHRIDLEGAMLERWSRQGDVTLLP